MSVSLLEKARIVIKAIRVIKNWHLYVALYLNFIKNEYIILETRNHVKIKLRVKSTDLMAFTNVWLLKEYEMPGFEIKNNDIVIDIGAHVGLFALYSAQFCKSGWIYCFEPIKENFDMLKMNVKLNNFTNIIASNEAISIGNGAVIIYLNDDEAGHSMHIAGSKFVQVKSVSLQSVFDSHNIERCDFLKVDCEGEEYAIMNSLPTSYFNKIRKICMECHFTDTKSNLAEELIKKLESFSFKIKTTKNLENMKFLYATR